MADTSTPAVPVAATPKSGFFTSEFWVTIATILASVLGFIHLPAGLIVVLVAAYGAFRTIIKVLAPSVTIPAWVQQIIDALAAQQQTTPSSKAAAGV
jgi:hypothetical protein